MREGQKSNEILETATCREIFSGAKLVDAAQYLCTGRFDQDRGPLYGRLAKDGMMVDTVVNVAPVSALSTQKALYAALASASSSA